MFFQDLHITLLGEILINRVSLTGNRRHSHGCFPVSSSVCLLLLRITSNPLSVSPSHWSLKHLPAAACLVLLPQLFLILMQCFYNRNIAVWLS